MKNIRRIISLILISCIMANCLILSSCGKEDTSIPQTDMTGIEYYQTPSENIVVDAESGMTYVNNEILITATEGCTEEQLAGILESYGGKIVGKIQALNEYQVQFDKEYSYNEIQTIKNKLSKSKSIKSSSPNLAIELNECSFYPNDSEWKKEWDDISDGSNWGMEAIDAPGAWKYKDEMQTVNIGVLDSMFYTEHEDLVFSEEPLGNATAINNMSEFDSHGTHVAGTVAATFDNKKGVSGVSVKQNLYGVAYNGISSILSESYSDSYDDSTKMTIQGYKVSLYYLIVQKKCRVINVSQGCYDDSFAATRIDGTARKAFEEIADELGSFLKMILDLDEGYDFVICKASGNLNSTGNVVDEYKYFKVDDNDTQCELGYYNYSDYLKWLNGEESDYNYERYEERMKNGEITLEWGNVDAQYDLLSAITEKEIKDRIIVVGAVQNNGYHKEGGFLGIGAEKVHDGYRICDLSNCGERVDVVAPGDHIYSTSTNSTGTKSQYVGIGPEHENIWSGTSMATPHVSGVAALVYSINPNLTGDQVKQIICETATGEYTGRCGEQEFTYGMVNAKNAVEKAREMKNQSETASVYEPIELSEEEKQELAKVLGGICEVEYDSSNPNDSEKAVGLIMSLTSFITYPEKIVPEYFSGEGKSTDPLNAFSLESSDYYHYDKWNASNVDWILENILNSKPKHNEKPTNVYLKDLQFCDLTYYYKNGFYYATYDEGGNEGYGVSYNKVLYDGKYYQVKFKYQYGTELIADGYAEDDDYPINTQYATLIKKIIDGKEYWSLIKTSKTSDIDFDVYYEDAEEPTWKQLYVNYIKKNEKKDHLETQYQLAYIDDNNVPELIIDNGSIAGGGEICLISNNKVNSLSTYTYGVSYLERKNLFCSSGGHMDMYYDRIYKINNGKFVKLYDGSYGAEDNANVQYDENGEPIYKYSWNDKEVSEKQYNKKLKSVFDKSKAVNPYETAVSADVMISRIQNDFYEIYSAY